MTGKRRDGKVTFLCEFCGCEVPENDLRAAGPTTDEGFCCPNCSQKGLSKAHHLTDSQRRQLVPGDTVLVTDDSGNQAEFLVRHAPWQLGHGAWVIGLAGISGGYSLDRVERLVRSAPRPTYQRSSLQADFL